MSCCCSKSPVAGAAIALVLVGALNWGLVGIGMLAGASASWNVVNMLLGSWPVVEAIVYVLVGLGAVYKIVKCLTGKGECSTNGSMH